MDQLGWQVMVETIRNHVVSISTPEGSGTGFLISNSKTSQVCAVATAAHVVNHAHDWEEPIRIKHYATDKTIMVKEDSRAIFLDQARDTAAILFDRGSISFPSDPLPLTPQNHYLAIGNDVGWVGFPAIQADTLCFFSGKISAWVEVSGAYLVDGVAINGVSGGPAFICNNGNVMIIGVVSAYMPNRATGETLPGLGVIRDVKQFHDLAPTFNSLDEAKAEESPAANSNTLTNDSLADGMGVRNYKRN